METKAIADLRSHPGCQARLGLTEEAVKSYAAAYKAGRSLPPLEVFEVEGELIVVDGFHRLEAAKRAEVATLPVEIIGQGTIAEAEWEALGKNHNHGVRRTREDKRKAVQVALGNEGAAKMSNRKLGAYLDVSHTFVANERKMWDLCGNVDIPVVRWARELIGRYGANYWRQRCDQDVALCEEQRRAEADEREEYPYVHYVANFQWMRMAIAFNRARFKVELREGGVSYQYPLNLTHVACIIARECGYHAPWDQIREGISLDYDIPYDDTKKYKSLDGERRKLHVGVDIFEYGLMAPHRFVRLRSEGERCWDRPYRTPDREREWNPIAYSIQIRDDLYHVALDGSHLEPGRKTEKSVREWIDWHSTARGQRNYTPVRVHKAQP